MWKLRLLSVLVSTQHRFCISNYLKYLIYIDQHLGGFYLTERIIQLCILTQKNNNKESKSNMNITNNTI